MDEIARIITSTLDIDEVYERFAQEVKRLIPFDRINLNIIDYANGAYVIKYISGPTQPGRSPGDVIVLKGTQTEEVLSTSLAMLVDDLAVDLKYAADRELLQIGLHSRIILPLHYRGRVIATLSLHSCRIGEYGPEQQTVLERLANQIAPAVANAETYEHAKQEMDVADEVAKVITSTLDVDKVYERFAQQVKRLVDFDRISINLIDEAAGVFVFKYASGVIQSDRKVPDIVPLAGTQTGQVLQTGLPIIVSDVSIDSHLTGTKDFLQLKLHSSLMVPLKSQGKVIGTLGLRSRQRDVYGSREQAILERLANQIAPAMANAETYEQAKQEMAVVDEIARIITSTLRIDEVYPRFAASVQELVDFHRLAINITDHESGVFVFKYVSGETGDHHEPGDTISMEGTQTSQVALSGETLIRGDVTVEPGFVGDTNFLTSGMRSTIMVPLTSRGKIIGTMSLRNRRKHAYGTREQVILERLANQIAPAMENAQAFEDTLREKERADVTVTQLQALLNGVDAAVQFVNPQREAVWANNKFAEFFGIGNADTPMQQHSLLWHMGETLPSSLADPDKVLA